MNGISKCEQKIANTHPNKCTHPPTQTSELDDYNMLSLWLSLKRKEELKQTVKKLLHSADKKAEEAEKEERFSSTEDSTDRIKCLKKMITKYHENYIPKQDIEMKETEEKLKLIK